MTRELSFPFTATHLARSRREIAEHFEGADETTIQWGIANEVIISVFGRACWGTRLAGTRRYPYFAEGNEDRGDAYIHQSRVLGLASTRTVLRAIRSGALRAARLGTRGAYRVEPAAVDEWIVVPEVPLRFRDDAAKHRPAVSRAAATRRGRWAPLPVAVIEKRDRKRRDGKAYSVYRVRWYEADGRERSRTFDSRADAKAFEGKVRTPQTLGRPRSARRWHRDLRGVRG
jgi:excisionase family DNA binding protein